jgi:fermentation-respiration switch protein FrsA (DUF1100 family)
MLFRSFEKSQLYYPTSTIEFTPEDVGLPYEDVYFLASDGIRLNGWFIKAADPLATVLFCHGNGGNIGHRVELIALLNRLRLNMFIFDYRGYGRSSGSPNELGTYRDALAAFDYVSGLDDVDIRRTIIYGRSLGGTIAIYLATRVDCAGLIIENTPTSIVDLGKEIYPFLPVARLASNRYEAESRIAAVGMPVLIIHSRYDELVPFRHGRQLYEAAVEPKEFYATSVGHNEIPSLAEPSYLQTIAAFIGKCLDGEI